MKDWLRQGLAAAASAAVLSGPALAQDATRDASRAPADKSARTTAWAGEKDKLQAELGTGHDKTYYRTTLEKMGYWITAINTDSPTRLEYEVVKGPNSYEVQVDFANGKSSKVDVTSNVWKAANTRAALSNKDFRYVYPTAVESQANRTRDTVRNKAWVDEKGRMEASLGTGKDRAYYKPALERMGYKVTSVNESDPRNLEYEVVKGDTSYEVQVDFDASGKSTRVGVSTNMWEAESTDRAKGEK